MSRFDSLPADQKAVLQLVLKQGKRYEDLATMLRMEPAAVRERARDALDALGPDEAPGLTSDRQDEISDYLLGQQGADEADDTHYFLEGSASGRAWARVVADELEQVAPGKLPEIPGEGTAEAEPEPAPVVEEDREPAGAAAAAAPAAAPRRDRSSSKLGGVIFLLGVAALLALVLVIALGGDDDKESDKAGSTSTPARTSTNTSTTKVEAQINLRPAVDGSKSLGVANVVSQGGQRAIALIGQSLPESPRYAVWLYNSATDNQFLGFAPPVKSSGRLQGLAPVPEDFSRYKEIIITREQVDRPQKPGLIVLRGGLKS